MIRKAGLFTILAFLALMAGAQSASAGVQLGVGIRIGPPPPRHEVIVARPYPGAIWIAGHWGWRRQVERYAWIRGHWIAPRAGWFWVDGHWQHAPGGWAWLEGHWRR